jgi:hypothetical protein
VSTLYKRAWKLHFWPSDSSATAGVGPDLAKRSVGDQAHTVPGAVPHLLSHSLAVAGHPALPEGSVRKDT